MQRCLPFFLVLIFFSAYNLNAQPDALGNFPTSYSPLPQTQTENQLIPKHAAETDEIGLLGYNLFLGGLGANGGYVAVPDAGGVYNLTSNGTIEAWVYPTAATS